MNRQMTRFALLIIVSIVAVAMFIWIENSFSPNLRSCINYNSAQDSANSNKSKNLVIRELLGRQTICTMRLIDRHNGFFSAIVTALLALIAWRQAFIAREQSNTSRAQLRAYVMVDKATTVDFGPVPKAEVIFKNYGQTPAYNLTIWTSVEVAVDDLKNKAAAPPSGPAASGSLGPGGFVHTLDAPERVILPPEVQAVKEGRASFYVYGQALYRDVFGEAHATDFCFVYGGEEGVHPGGLMGQYKTWNKAT
jgi:hypothetical protein